LALTRADIAASAEQLLDAGYGLWLASNRDVLAQLRHEPLGVEVAALDVLAPHDRGWRIADLMRVYNVLNATSFGPKGIPLQNWVMIDLGLLPSAFLLITLSAQRAADALSDLRLPAAQRDRVAGVLPAVLAEAERLGYAGPIPVAGYCAAATPVPGGWWAGRCARRSPGSARPPRGSRSRPTGRRRSPGLPSSPIPPCGCIGSSAACGCWRRSWSFTRLPHTLVYRTDVFAEDPAEPDPTLMVDARDSAAQRALQDKLDAGEELFILSPGLVEGRVPILERS